MLISVRCTCGRRLKVTEAKIGKTGNCPACHATLRLVAPGYTAGRDEFDHLLVIAAGPERPGEVILLAGCGPVEIGKLADKHIALPGKSVSRGHCRLVRNGDGGWSIEDQHSTNGVFVNGQRVDARDLAEGDVVHLGEYELKFGRIRDIRLAADIAGAVIASSLAEPASVEPVRSGQEFAPPEHASDSQNPALTDAVDAVEDDSLYRLSDGDAVDVPRPEPTAIKPIETPTGGPTCPSCGKSLVPKAKICVTCGIDLKTGRAILTSHGGDLDAVYTSVESVVRWASWIVWFGIYPVASEGFGLRKPYFTQAITLLTVLVSAWFLAYEWTDSPRMASMKNHMLWVGDAEPTPGQILYYYTRTHYGDSEAFQAKYEELEAGLEAKRAEILKKVETAANRGDDVRQEAAKALAELRRQEAEIIVAAHKSLAPDKQFQGHYAPAQLITYAFLHGGIMHLIGNMVFLLVIGSRINALVGNLTMIVLYPALAVSAGIIFMASQQGSSPHPCLGASGAIMGLSGIYLVLMPVHRIHMVAWLRPVISLRLMLQLYFKLWSMRGFWVVLFYIAFDVIAVLRNDQGGVAHWAHLGGFITGMAIGMLLLFTRLVNCRGGDIVSGLLGKHAWGLVGKPDLTRKAPLEYGW